MPAPSLYTATLTTGSLKPRESRVVAGLLLDDVSDTDRKDAIARRNVLQARAPASAFAQGPLAPNTKASPTSTKPPPRPPGSSNRPLSPLRKPLPSRLLPRLPAILPPPPPPATRSQAALVSTFLKKPFLENSEEVEDFLSTLRAELTSAITRGERIQLK